MGVISDDCTAKTPQLLEGYTAITNDSDDEIIEGTMPNNGSINGILNCGESKIIPLGYFGIDGLTKIWNI